MKWIEEKLPSVPEAHLRKCKIRKKSFENSFNVSLRTERTMAILGLSFWPHFPSSESTEFSNQMFHGMPKGMT